MSSTVERLGRHPLSSIWGQMATDVRRDFEEGIMDGVDPDGLVIYTLDNQILDGWWRYNFFLDNGIEVVLKEYTGDDPLGFVLRRNGNRRHLTAGQRTLAIMDAYDWKKSREKGEPSDLEEESEVLDSFGLAEKANVSRQTARQAVRVEEAGVGDFVRRGELHMRAASDIARHEDVLKKLKSGAINAAEAVEKVKRRRPPSKADNLEAELKLAEREVDRQEEQIDRLEEEVRFLRDLSDGDSKAENIVDTFVGQQNMIRTLRTLMRRWMGNFERMKRSRDYWKARAMRAENALGDATVAEVRDDPDVEWDGSGDVINTNDYVESVTEYFDESGPVPEVEAEAVLSEPERTAAPPVAFNGGSAPPAPVEEPAPWSGGETYGETEMWLYGADLNDHEMLEQLMNSVGDGAEPLAVEDEAPRGSMVWDDPEELALAEIDDEYGGDDGGARRAGERRRGPPNGLDDGGAIV